MIPLVSCQTDSKPSIQETAPAIAVKDNVKVDDLTDDAVFSAIEIQGESVYNFGEIKAGEVVEHTFQLRNTGIAPLIISDIQTTCGCTTPDFEKGKLISPGESTDVLVRFNSQGKSGIQNKKVTIFANTAESVHAVYMKGNVLVDQANS